MGSEGCWAVGLGRAGLVLARFGVLLGAVWACGGWGRGLRWVEGGCWLGQPLAGSARICLSASR